MADRWHARPARALPLAHVADRDADPVRPAPAIEGTPPVAPNLPRAAEAAGAHNRVGRTIIETLVFRGLTTPLALGLVVLQSRFLDPSGRGALVLVALSATILARLFGQLGYAVTSRMREHGAELRPLVHRALGLAASLGGTGMAAILLWAHLTRGIGVETGAIAAAALLPTIVVQSISGVLLGLGEVRLWNWIQLLPQLATLAGLVAFVVALGGGVRAAVLASTLAWALTAAFALVATQRIWRPFDLPNVLDLFSLTLARLALVMGAVQVVNLISYRVELYVLDRYRGIADVGVYSISVQAAETIWLIAGAIATSVTAPAVREPEGEAARLIRRSALRGLAYSAGVAVVLALVAPSVIPALLGGAFSGAARPLAILLPGVVVYAPVTVLVVYLSVRRGQPRLSLAVSALGTIVTTAAALLLIPRYGASGAAAASTAGYAAGAVAAWAFFARLSRRPGTLAG